MDKKGLLFAFGAYLTWGLFPVYWKWLQKVGALELLSHRIIWSFAFLFLAVLVGKNWRDFRASLQNRKVIAVYFTAAILIGINWLTYVWAVNAGFIVETSLGYFINPLLSVSLGVLFLRERLRPLQWLPIGLATLGVAYLTFAYGRLPWIALVLAFSFGLYGLVKKNCPAWFCLWPDSRNRHFAPASPFLPCYPRSDRSSSLSTCQYHHQRVVSGRGRRYHNPVTHVRFCRPPHPAHHDWPHAIPGANAAIPAGRAGLQRTIQRNPGHRLWRCVGCPGHFLAGKLGRSAQHSARTNS